jgi:hypothetical protein
VKADTSQVVIGHHTAKGWVIDEIVSRTIAAGDHTLGLSIYGTTVSVTLDNQAAVSHVYNAVTTDGKFGLLGTAASSFDLVKITTNDNAFRVQTNHLETALTADASAAGGGSTLTTDALAPIIKEAISRWSSLMQLDAAHLDLLNQITFQIWDFDGLVLGQALEADRTIILDSDAAGYGWFIDATASDDSEFAVNGTAAGDMDLLSVVMHEMGHILGFGHQTANEQLSGIMAEYLTAGTRTSMTREAIANRREATYYFDEATGQFVSLDKRYTADEPEEQELAFYLAEEGATAATSPNDWLVLV